MPRKNAKSIEERAADEGARGGRLSAAKRALRDSLMVTRRGQRWTVEQIMEEAQVDRRTVQRVLNEREMLGDDLLTREPTETIRHMAAQLEQTAANLEAMAVEYADSHPAVAVGAIGRALNARRDLLTLYRDAGRVPKDMSYIGNVIDLHEIADEMIRAVRALKRGDMDADEVEETFKRALGLGRPRSELKQT